MGKDWISPLTRVAFTLDYAGLGGRTMVLDGGLPAWKAAGKAVTADLPAPASVTGTLRRHQGAPGGGGLISGVGPVTRRASRAAR